MKKIFLLITLSLSIFLVSCSNNQRELTNNDMNILVGYMDAKKAEQIGSCTKQEFINEYMKLDEDFKQIYIDYCKRENIKREW